MQDFSKILTKVKNVKLLYIEDNEDVRNSTVGLFGNIFQSIAVAVDGEDAIVKLEASDYGYALVITDINMPKVDGYGVIDKIRKKEKDIKIYILSAYNQIDNIQKAGAQVDAYLYKPLDIKMLFNVLEKDFC